MGEENLADGELDIVRAEEILRPTANQLASAWKTIVIEERLQVERLPNRPAPEDFYQPIAESFRGQPERQDDAVLQRLKGLARPEETWLDLGAGGGRYALPMSRQVSRLIAIEPSAGMRRVLLDAITQNTIHNIELFSERWPGLSEAPIADVGMIANVGHDIEDIGPFLDQLEAHSHRLCIAVLSYQAPISFFAPLWPLVHGEAIEPAAPSSRKRRSGGSRPRSDSERVQLPGAGELIALLLSRRVLPEVSVLDLAPRVFPDLAALHQQARRPLWVLEGSEADKRLERAVRAVAISTQDGFSLTERPRQLAIVTWRPHAAT